MTRLMNFLSLLYLSLVSLSKGFGSSSLLGTNFFGHARKESFFIPPLYSATKLGRTNENKDNVTSNNKVHVYENEFVLKKSDSVTRTTYKQKRVSFFRRRRRNVSPSSTTLLDDEQITFQYRYKEMVIPASTNSDDDDDDTATQKIRIILLVQPIGVGIGGWYYDRLLEQFFQTQKKLEEESDCTTNIYLVPDLLACGGSASVVSSDGTTSRVLKKIPLLHVTDWSQQLMELMSTYEKKLLVLAEDDANEQTPKQQIEWCLISNGGCIPIPLEIAKQYYANNPNCKIQGKLKHLILSAPPRISSLLKSQDTKKIQKSYRVLSGIAGTLFWWYALRKDGAFIQKFSETNLVSDPKNLGKEWVPTCVKTAKDGFITRFSTFAFLAGSLNGANQERLEALRGDWLNIDVITGRDKRSNPAKSWFWTRSKKNTKNPKDKNHNNRNETLQQQTTEITSLVSYLKDNGFSGREIIVKGRRCPAYEDPVGYAEAVARLLKETP